MVIGREGTATKKRRSKLPPIPTYAGRMTKRADMRARVQLDRAADFEKLSAGPGVLLLVEADFADGFEIVAAEVYAVHPEWRFIDVHLRAPLPLETDRVAIKRTSLGVIP